MSGTEKSHRCVVAQVPPRGGLTEGCHDEDI